MNPDWNTANAWCYEKFQHHSIFHHSKSNSAEHNELFYDSSYPIPLIGGAGNFCDQNRGDAVFDLSKSRKEFEKNKITLKRKCPSDWDYLKTLSAQENPKEAPVVSEKVLAYMEHLTKDPFPEISEQENKNIFVHMGGNLDSVTISSQEAILIQPNYEEFRYMNIRKLDFSKPILFSHQPPTDKTDPIDSPVLEIFKSPETSRVIDLALREKNRFLFSSVQNVTRIVKNLNCQTFEWPRMLMGGAFVNSNEFSFLDLDHVLTRIDLANFNINYSKELGFNPKYRLPVAVREWDVNQVTLTDPLHVKLLDFRTNDLSTMIKMPTGSYDCTKISIQARSDTMKNVLLLGTSHHLSGYDLRSPSHPLFQWSHQLQHNPTILKMERFAGNEVICLASNYIGDWRIFNVQHDEGRFHINRFTVKPKSLRNSIDEVKLRGKLLHEPHFDYHMTKGVSGITMVNENNRFLHLFTQNCLNDVFHSFLIPSKMAEENPGILDTNCTFQDFVMTSFHKYAIRNYFKRHKSDERDHKNYTLQSLASMEPMKRYLRKANNEKETNMKTEVEPTNPVVIEERKPWQVDIEELKKYKDVLAADLLSVWLDDVDDVVETRPIIEVHGNEAGPSMISTWVDNTICKEEIDIEDKMSVDLEPLIVPEPEKKMVRRKSYVKGF